MKKKLFWIGLLVLPVALWVVSLPPGNSEQLAAAGAEFVVAAKGRVDVEGGVVHVAASRQGIVREVLVEEGDRVEKGQVLARIDDRLPRLELRVSQAEQAVAESGVARLKSRLEQARRDLKRFTALAERNAVSRQQCDKARDEVVNLESDLRHQQAALERLRRSVAVQEFEVDQYAVRAPLDARVVRRLVQPGVGTSTLQVTDLFLLLPYSERIVRAEVEERYISRLDESLPVQVEPLDGEGRSLRGRVRRIGRIMGARRDADLSPNDRVDVRVVEVVVALEEPCEDLLVGQRVMARFGRRK